MSYRIPTGSKQFHFRTPVTLVASRDSVAWLARLLFKSGGFAGLALLVSNILWVGLAAQDSRAVVVSIAEVKKTPTQDLARRKSVRVRGVVTYYNTNDKTIFLQDQTGAIYIFDFPQGIVSTAGTEIEVEGVLSEGNFAPIIQAKQVNPFGPAPLPLPRSATLFQLSRGAFDSERVQATGIVLVVQTNQFGIEAALGEGRDIARIVLSGGNRQGMLTNYLGARVRVTGIAVPEVNSSHQSFGARIFVGPMEQIETLEMGDGDSSLPVSSLSSLLQFGSSDATQPIRRSIGRVTAFRTPKTFFLDDGTAGVIVSALSPPKVEVGDVVEVLGTASIVENQAFFRSADVRRNDASVNVPVFPIVPADLQNLKFWHRRVSVAARVLSAEPTNSTGIHDFTLDFGSRVVFVTVRDPKHLFRLPRSGSQVLLKGVLDFWDDGRWVDKVVLYVGDASEIMVTKGPPFDWAVFWAWMVLSLAIVAVSIGIWVGILRRKVARYISKLRSKETELQKVVDNLETNRNWLMALVNNIPDSMWLKDTYGRYLAVNDAYARSLGISSEGIVGRLTEEVVPSRWCARFLREDARLLVSRVPIQREECLVMDDGSERLFETWKASIWNEAGEVIGTLGIGRDITERKRAEAEHFRQTARMFALINNVPDPMWLKDANHRYLAVNEAWCSTLGVRQIDVLGKRADEVLPMEIVQQITADERKVLDSLSPLQKEESLVLASGQREWFETWQRAIRGADGEILGVVGIARNITEKKLTESALAKYQLVSDQVRDVILFFRPETGLVVEANRAASEFFGISREELFCRRIQDLEPDAELQIPPDMRGIPGNGFRYETVYKQQNGQALPVEIRARVGVVAGETLVVCVLRDVTQRKKLENELRALNIELEQRVAERTREALELYNNAPCGYHSVGPDGRVQQMNDTELMWLGYSREEVEGKMYFSQLLMPEDAIRFEMVFADFVAHGDMTHAEWNMRHKDGKPIPVLVQVRAIRDLKGNFIKTQTMAVDFRERYEIEAQLRQAKEDAETASRAKTIFLANISHELRTTLNAVLGFSQLLLRDPVLGDRSLKHARAISRNGEHLVELISDILEMARIESGRIILREVPFNGHQLVDDIRGMFEDRARSRGLTFGVIISGGFEGLLIGDATKIRQILVNLLGNAVKFTSRGGITLELKGTPVPENQLRIDGSVEDTGAGMTSEEMVHLFEPFYQTEAGRTIEGGTGLGLRITRQFLRLMGGDVRITSQAGVGTRCEFLLHVKLPSPADQSSIERPSPVVQMHLHNGLAAEFQSAAESADYHGLLKLVDRVSSSNPGLASHLRQMVESYDYDHIIRICQEAL